MGVYQILKELVDFGSVVPGTTTQSEVVNYLQNWYKRIGWISYAQRFEDNNIPFVNVIGVPKNITTPVTIVGAHFDTVPETDGANDNKSATAVLLEIAEKLAKEGREDVIVVHFDGEEEIGEGEGYVKFDEKGNLRFNNMFYGSIYFVRKMVREGIPIGTISLTKDKVEKSIIIDMCGAKNVDHIMSFAGDSRVMRLLYDTDRKLGTALFSNWLLDAWSDQTAFFMHGIPTVMMADAYKEAVLKVPGARIFKLKHTKEDSIDKIDPEKLEKTVNVVYSAACARMQLL